MSRRSVIRDSNTLFNFTITDFLKLPVSRKGFVVCWRTAGGEMFQLNGHERKSETRTEKLLPDSVYCFSVQNSLQMLQKTPSM
jgi:hypothetical protein